MSESRDRVNVRTPLRCPICEGELRHTLIRDLGGVTGDLTWQLHAGECPEHGWFQTEVISRPPREIFPVEKPFGVVRRLVVNGQEVYSFPTVWNDLPRSEKGRKVDPFDPTYWRVRRITDATGVARPPESGGGAAAGARAPRAARRT